MKILVSYRAIPQSPGWATGDMVVRAFRYLGHKVRAFAKYYQEDRMVETVTSDFLDGYDLILFMECNDGDPQYTNIKEMFPGARKTACWFFDTSYYPDHLTGLANHIGFDHHFIANPLNVRHFKNASCLPYACDSYLHFRQSWTPKNTRCSLVGSIREDRKALASLLESRGIKLDLIGGKFREAYIDALAESEAVVNQNPDQGYGLYNMRQFEAPAAGAIILTEKRDYDANPDVFQDGLNCFVYENHNDLADILNMLEDETQYKEMVRIAGQNHVLCHHTYEARCKQILTTLFPDEVH
jgi:hypothetical protein